ncbi:MAG: FAD-binding oxidoreductase [Pseudomonadota bacterium]
MSARATPYWWEDAGAPASPPQTSLPDEADVVVIGAGLTGLSAARTLAKNGKSVLALDAAAPGAGASARNGGMIGGGHRLSLDDMEARFGPTVAHGLLREAHLDSFAFVRAVIEDEEIACDFAETGRFRGFWRSTEYEATARWLARLQTVIPLEAEMIPKARQRQEVASDLYAGGVVFPRHGALNPAKLVAGLMAAARRAGATVQGDTPVRSLSRAQGGFRVETARGTVKAGQVLAATNGYTDAALPSLRRRIIPIPSFIVASEPLGENRVRDLFPSGRMIVESRERHCYYRPSPDGKRLVFGGRAALFEAPENFTTGALRGLIAEVFPDLGPIEFSHAWRGRTGFSFDFLPNVGQIDGVWHALGYSGSGNAMAPWLGHKAALLMLGDPEGETAFSQTRLPTRWWHRGRPWFLPFADALFRARDVAASFGRSA